MEMYIESGGSRRNLIVRRETVSISKCERYEEIMISENDIPVFLKCRQNYINDIEQTEYDVQSMVSLVDLARVRPLNISELTMIVESISECKDAVEEYLLSLEGLTLNPEFVFYDKTDKKLKFCFNTYNDNDIFSSFMSIGEFLVSAVDYKDEEAVKLAYDIYAAIINKDFDLKRLIPSRTKDTDITNTEYKCENNDTNEPAYEVGNENNNLLPRFTAVSTICATIASVEALFFTLIFIFERKLFMYFMSDIRVISITLLLFSIFIYVPVMNLLDINHAKRLISRG